MKPVDVQAFKTKNEVQQGIDKYKNTYEMEILEEGSFEKALDIKGKIQMVSNNGRQSLK